MMCRCANVNYRTKLGVDFLTESYFCYTGAALNLSCNNCYLYKAKFAVDKKIEIWNGSWNPGPGMFRAPL